MGKAFGSFLLIILFVSCQDRPKQKSTDTGESEVVAKNPPQALPELAGYRYMVVEENSLGQDSPLPLIVSLHWMGSDPQAFSGFVSGFDFPCRIIHVQAPYPFEEGYSFFPVAPRNYYEMDALARNETILRESQKLSRFIEAVTAKYKPPFLPVVIGASQGGDLSYMSAVHHSGSISGAFPLLAVLDETIMAQDSVITCTVPIRVHHGLEDSIVPMEQVTAQVNFLKDRSCDVRLYTYPDCDHEIPERMQQAYKAQIRSLVQENSTIEE